MRSTAEKILDLPHYTEGPAVDGAGNRYVTTLTGGKILRLDPSGGCAVWARADCPNGQVILPDGAHWVCDTRRVAIARFNPDGSPAGEVLRGRCAGVVVHCPNDLLVDSDQNLYFTDSVRERGKVFFVGADGRERVVATGIDYANGLALSPDETRLYVAESHRNRILMLDLNEPGHCRKPPDVFAPLPVHPSGNPLGNLPDGLAIDHRGRLWVAHYGLGAVQVLSEGGEVLASLETHLPLTSNLCFLEDAPPRQTLLVTGGYGEPGPGGVVLLTVYP